MRTTILAVLVVGFMLAQSGRGRAQATLPPTGTPGAVFLQVVNQCNVTIAKNGAVLGLLTFPKGTLLSAVANGNFRFKIPAPDAYRPGKVRIPRRVRASRLTRH